MVLVRCLMMMYEYLCAVQLRVKEKALWLVRLTFGQVKDLSTPYTISDTKKCNAKSSCMFLE